jgi:two-component system sensor histidine kinase DesK
MSPSDEALEHETTAPGAIPGEPPAAQVRRWAAGWRRVLLATGMLVYPLITGAGVAQYSVGAAAVIGWLIVAAFIVGFAVAALAFARFARRLFWATLGVMTLLFVAALPIAHENAFALCAVIVSMATPVLRGRAAPVIVVAAAASLVVPWVWPGWDSGPAWTQAIMIVFTALLVYAFTEIVRANQALIAARDEVAQLASEAERNRIARDLHDLIGHSLTAITVKSNLARRLAAAESSPALQEITEVEQLSRQALADVRAAVSGYSDVTIAGELARGRELLRASGVTADLPTAVDGIGSPRQEVLGWALREGLTNVVRHARATRCTVIVSPTQIEIRDDGVGRPARPGSAGRHGGGGSAEGLGPGNGLSGLGERVAAVGGRVEAGPLDPHGWRLFVTLDATDRVRT